MNNNTKGLIVAGASLGVLALAYYFLVYRKNNNADDINFSSVQDNLGLKANKDDVVIAPFNDKKNFAQFYTNNRIVIFDSAKNVVVKGS